MTWVPRIGGTMLGVVGGWLAISFLWVPLDAAPFLLAAAAIVIGSLVVCWRASGWWRFGAVGVILAVVPLAAFFTDLGSHGLT